MKLIVTYIFAIFFGLSLHTASGQTSDIKAQQIVDRAIALHGGDLYKQSKVSFTFRTKRHTVEQNDHSYVYDRVFEEDGNKVRDVLDNGDFKRYVNGKESAGFSRTMARAFEDVNAVTYFAMLPYKLNDGAVVKEYVGVVTIKGRAYDKIKVTFEGEGSGDSPDNIFYYWFDQESGFMHYLAYNKGGNRFRAPFNQRIIEGIRFADYINYSGGDYDKRDISEYDKLYDQDKLKELSRIILENVQVEIKG